MRTTFFIVVMLVLLSTVSIARAEHPQWPTVVKGYGLNLEGAKKHALTEAVLNVQQYVRELSPPLEHWQVTEEYVEKNLLQGPGEKGPDVKIGDAEKGTTWILRLKWRPDVEEFTRLDRQAYGTRRATERQSVSPGRWSLAGSVIGGVLTLLVLTMAYAHLRERKKS